MKWTTIFIAALALAVVRPELAHADKAGFDALKPLVGDYVVVERKRATEGRNASIDKVVDDMSFMIRPIARSRLRDGNPIPKTLRIRQDGARMTVSFDGRDWTAAVGGKAVEGKGSSGDPLKMTFTQDGTELTQRFIGEQGGKENVFRRTEDGLLVRVRIFSKRLPGDVVYRLKLRRK